jgi:tetratricopeptide (TPR) repeat protein
MAPEQVQHPEAVDHRADIYALGMVFYQMLTGQLPAKPIEPPSRKVQIDVRLDEIVLRALEKNPETRYQHASVLKTQVETIVATPSDPVVAEDHPQPSIATMNTNSGKSNWPWAIAAVATMCVLVLGLVMFIKTREPRNVDYRRNGDIKQDKGDWNGAIDAYNKAIKLRPGDPSNYHRRADAKLGKADWDGAIADYNKAIELISDEASKSSSYHRLGDAMMGKSDWDEAIAYFTKAIEAVREDGPRSASYHRRGDAERGKKDWDDAIADYTKAIELKPDDAGAYFNRSRAKKAKGDIDGASADYNKAIQLEPNLK